MHLGSTGDTRNSYIILGGKTLGGLILGSPIHKCFVGGFLVMLCKLYPLLRAQLITNIFL
jgi:hypothetical protein